MSIQRWDVEHEHVSGDGEFVLYEDHLAEVKALQESNVQAVAAASESKDRRISQLEGQVARLENDLKGAHDCQLGLMTDCLAYAAQIAELRDALEAERAK